MKQNESNPFSINLLLPLYNLYKHIDDTNYYCIFC